MENCLELRPPQRRIPRPLTNVYLVVAKNGMRAKLLRGEPMKTLRELRSHGAKNIQKCSRAYNRR